MVLMAKPFKFNSRGVRRPEGAIAPGDGAPSTPNSTTSDQPDAFTDADEWVDVVLPCYNAAEWVDEFIGGLLPHDDVRWRLFARDDGSKDGTRALLKGWQERLGERMIVLDADGSENLGLVGNYNAVLAATSARWVLTADPDDVWLPTRLPLTLKTLRQAEAAFGIDVPIAVCTDAVVVDGQLAPVADSYWRWSKARPLTRPKLARMAMDSVALGSTMAVNRALLQRALPLPAGAAYQDWWLALVAVAFGRFVALPERTIKYRRHGANATKDPLSLSLLKDLSRFAGAPVAIRARLDYLLRQAARQARIFASRYEKSLPASDFAAMRDLGLLPDASVLAKRIWIVRHGLWFSSWFKNIGLFVFA
jgi:glycosyltransferase involved in cell wall biosynthesis